MSCFFLCKFREKNYFERVFNPLCANSWNRMSIAIAHYFVKWPTIKGTWCRPFNSIAISNECISIQTEYSIWRLIWNVLIANVLFKSMRYDMVEMTIALVKWMIIYREIEWQDKKFNQLLSKRSYRERKKHKS